MSQACEGLSNLEITNNSNNNNNLLMYSVMMERQDDIGYFSTYSNTGEQKLHMLGPEHMHCHYTLPYPTKQLSWQVQEQSFTSLMTNCL